MQKVNATFWLKNHVPGLSMLFEYANIIYMNLHFMISCCFDVYQGWFSGLATRLAFLHIEIHVPIFSGARDLAINERRKRIMIVNVWVVKCITTFRWIRIWKINKIFLIWTSSIAKFRIVQSLAESQSNVLSIEFAVHGNENATFYKQLARILSYNITKQIIFANEQISKWTIFLQYSKNNQWNDKWVRITSLIPFTSSSFTKQY